MGVIEIIFVAVLSIYGTINGIKWKDINKPKKVFVIVAWVGAIIIGWNKYQKWAQDKFLEKVNADFGDITNIKGAKIPQLRIGASSKEVFTLSQDAVLYIKEKPVIKLLIKKDKLLVSTIIRKFDGKAIAGIYQNQWEMFDNKDYDYNNDETAFEVVTKPDRNLYFQVELKDGVAGISGFLLNDKGEGVFLLTNASTKTGGWIKGVNPEQEFKFQQTMDRPIFKYPRKRFVGVREKY
jgi:hypothetical protein